MAPLNPTCGIRPLDGVLAANHREYSDFIGAGGCKTPATNEIRRNAKGNGCCL
jgi:hypothetical protein